ncbi:hypothetical protein ABIA14_005378 [Sinorhizobium fredii]|nr:hypothetical protein [Sinorhizobium fredii]AWM28054.1 Formyltetrahydrofolate deformylase [Sinorhizobium fredii CCBAU 25509]
MLIRIIRCDVSIGRDVESQVLARAVHAHIHHRTFINGNRVVVFPPSRELCVPARYPRAGFLDVHR